MVISWCVSLGTRLSAFLPAPWECPGHPSGHVVRPQEPNINLPLSLSPDPPWCLVCSLPSVTAVKKRRKRKVPIILICGAAKSLDPGRPQLLSMWYVCSSCLCNFPIYPQAWAGLVAMCTSRLSLYNMHSQETDCQDVSFGLLLWIFSLSTS